MLSVEQVIQVANICYAAIMILIMIIIIAGCFVFTKNYLKYHKDETIKDKAKMIALKISKTICIAVIFMVIITLLFRMAVLHILPLFIEKLSI